MQYYSVLCTVVFDRRLFIHTIKFTSHHQTVPEYSNRSSRSCQGCEVVIDGYLHQAIPFPPAFGKHKSGMGAGECSL